MQQVRITSVATRDPRLKGLKNEAREQVVQTIKEEIAQELLRWLVTQPPDSYDALPEDSPLRSNLRPGDHFNALLRLLSGDIHAGSPVEILHTILLGLIKYVWHYTNTPWKDKQCESFAI
ncbi:hypothetical protein B0H21DRAFT_766280 [Amylocystis lapponica]|nr:hypothetical protein B0H21DRAFT_766280 [Amylocystis lapponica]